MVEELAADDGLEYRAALADGARALLASQCGLNPTEAHGEARRLFVDVLGLDALDLVRVPERRLVAEEFARYRSAIARRCTGEPVSRIVGRRGFYGRDFTLTPATLDPRPETETIVEVALEWARRRHPDGTDLDIADIGTGGGVILVTLLAELAAARGIGIDPSSAALAVAFDNAHLHGVGARATWACGRGFAGLDRRFSLIVSNPPYIPSGDIAALDREVRDFDPPLALDGGPDGLTIYRAIGTGLDTHLGKGLVVLEVGFGQAESVAAIMATSLGSRIDSLRIIPDLAGISRCVAVETQN